METSYIVGGEVGKPPRFRAPGDHQRDLQGSSLLHGVSNPRRFFARCSLGYLRETENGVGANIGPQSGTRIEAGQPFPRMLHLIDLEVELKEKRPLTVENTRSPVEATEVQEKYEGVKI